MTRTNLLLAAVITFVFAGTPAFADKPDWKSSGSKGAKHEQKDQSSHGKSYGSKDDRGFDDKEKGSPKSYKKAHFEDRHQAAVRDYYDHEFRSGHCPPGLEKKHNGCMPPGQAKKWGVGRSLPRDVVFYELPGSLVSKLGMPPSGHRYVRVGKDILMIATGSRMVIEAIEDLSK